MAKRRCPASSATAPSSSAICWRPRATSARSALATGHYVASRRLADGSRALVCAADADRDQSYFLFATTREQLDYPALSARRHDQARGARAGAALFALEVADKQDSQDICFVPTGRYTDIIGRLRPNAMQPGDIVDLDGRVLGAHHGHCQFHRRPAQGPRHCGQPPALRGAARCGEPPRRGRPARGAAHGPHRAARRQLDRRRRARSVIGDGIEMFVRVRSTRPPQPAWLRAVRWRLRGRTGRGRGGRVARPGLRVLRCAIGAGARARRRLYQERVGEEYAARETAAPLEAMRG